MEFGLTLGEFEQLTFKEFNTFAEFSLNRLKQLAELDRNVQLNALYNSKRQKGQKFLNLFEDKKQGTKKVIDEEEIKRQRAFLFGE